MSEPLILVTNFLLIFLLCGLLIAILIAAVKFFFNPLGLGPEPKTVLSREFFAEPAQELLCLDLLIDGAEAFNKILEAVDSAASSIYVQTFIWKDDTIGTRVASGLKSAARRGVKVTVGKDILGTFFELGDMLRGKPSPVFTRSGLKGYENINVHLDLFADTDHSKYFIVDEQLVVFGGMNIADEYHAKWHDYMAAIGGSRWAKAFKDRVLKSAPWPNSSPFMVAINDHNATEIRTALIELIDHASKSIIIEHAYFSDDKVIEAVRRASERGVDAALILPEKPGTHLYANRVTINRLLESDSKKRIKIYLYPKMSHAKVMLADGKIAAIGSANLTPRSMLTSREVTLFAHGVGDDPFIKKLREQLILDISESKSVLKPFHLDFIDKMKALTGKYVW